VIYNTRTIYSSNCYD